MTAAKLPAITEAEFQRQVTDLAEVYGWSWAHFRPAQTSRGWRTPVSGPLGKGWPDLTLVRVRDRRLIFAELKRDGAKPTADQAAVLAALDVLAGGFVQPSGKLGVLIHVVLWRPADLEQIAEVLR